MKKGILRLGMLAFCAIGFITPVSAILAKSTTTFLIDEEYDRSKRSEVEANLHYTSQNAYFYIEKDYFEELSPIQIVNINSRIVEIGNNFDKFIYPQTRNVFGEEWTPGIDKESKITILLSRLDYNIGGYFNPNDEYVKDSVFDNKSNEREMIYINPDFIDDPRLESFIAHEFQHMITWNQKTRVQGVMDEIWSNEGRSELASSFIEDAVGIDFIQGNLHNRKTLFSINYGDSLIDWNNRNYDYGTVSMFSQYLRDQLGTEPFKKITSNDQAGIKSIEKVLKENYQTDFKKIFTDWTIANYINDIDFNRAYGYKNENLQGEIIRPEKIQIDPEDNQISIETDLKNWSSKYYEISFIKREAKSFYVDINFNGNNSGIFVTPYIIKLTNGEKQVKFLELNEKQDGIIRIKSTNDIESITILPSSQKYNEAVDSNQAGSYIFRLSLNIAPMNEQTLSNILADGSLVKTIDSEKIYVIEKGKRRWIANPETFADKEYAWNNIVTISNSEIDQYAEGEKLDTKTERILNGLLVKSSGPEVYLIQSKQKRWIQNEEIFNSYGFSWKKIISVSSGELLSYSQGDNLPIFPFKNNDLISGTGLEVYVVDGNQIRWITSPEVFARNGYKWPSIIKTTDETISYLVKGQEIK
jgi:hypothetical protein